jgi:hypothetical protein
VDSARRAIESYEGPPERFLLPIADTMNDSFGVNVAIVLDTALGKGWEPAGFVQKQGHRVYRFKTLS